MTEIELLEMLRAVGGGSEARYCSMAAAVAGSVPNGLDMARWANAMIMVAAGKGPPLPAGVLSQLLSAAYLAGNADPRKFGIGGAVIDECNDGCDLDALAADLKERKKCR